MTLFDPDRAMPSGRTEEDLAYGALEAVASLVPGGTQLLRAVLVPPLERRREEWLQGLEERVARLEAEGRLDPANLQTDAFIDTAVTATLAAIRTSQVRKRRALRNAVLNVALSRTSPEVIEQQIFLALTERFTDAHIALLWLFHAPAKWKQADGTLLHFAGRADARVLLETAIPDARSAYALYNQLWSDLYSDGLVRTPEIDNGMEGPVLQIKRTTELGDRYLAFITSPIEGDE